MEVAQEATIILGALTLVSTVYGALCSRAARASAARAELAASHAQEEAHVAVCSLGYAHGTLDVVSKQLELSRVREELPELERVEWTPSPENDTGED